MLFTVQPINNFSPIGGCFHCVATAAKRKLEVLADFRLVVRYQDRLAIARSVDSSCHKSQRTAYICSEVNNPGKNHYGPFTRCEGISFGYFCCILPKQLACAT